MSEETIFGETTPEPEVTNPAQQFALPQELAELVGEGKKYKTAEDALKSIPHAQSHIQKLEEEMKQMKEELMKRKAAEELLEEFKTTGFKPESTTSQTSPVDIEQVISKVLSQKEQQALALQNQRTVVSAFDAKYGEKGEEMFIQLAKDLGMPVQELNTLAAKSPKALFKMAGFEEKQKIPSRTSSSVNTEALANNTQVNKPSARLPKFATTQDLVQAWNNAKEKVINS